MSSYTRSTTVSSRITSTRTASTSTSTDIFSSSSRISASRVSAVPLDNLLHRRMGSLYKVLKTFTSSVQIDMARRATSEFFYMYDNLPYGQAARELMDEEDLLTVPMPLDLIDAYEVPVKEICTCTCPKYKFIKDVSEPVSTSISEPSTGRTLNLEFYTSRMGLKEVDVEEASSFGIDFASTPTIALDDYTFTPSFEIDVESILASMFEAQAEADRIKAAQIEAAKIEAAKVAAPTTKRRQTLAPSSAAAATTNNNKRKSVAPRAPAPVVKKVVSRSTTPTNQRQSLAPVRTTHKSVTASNIVAPVPEVKKVTNLKNRVSLAPMSKKERFADLGKGQYFIGGRRD